MEPTPSFTFQKEHPGRRTLFGKVDLILGLSIIFGLLVGLIWIGAILLNNIFIHSKEALTAKISQESVQWSSTLERQILSIPVRVAKTKQLLENHVYGSKAFVFLQANTLRTVSFSSITIKALSEASSNAAGANLEIDGEALDFDSLAKQIVWLRQTKGISQLSISNVARQEQGRIKFNLVLDVDNQFFKAPSSK